MALEGKHEFGPNNGRVIGWLGIVAALLVVASALSDGFSGGDAVVMSWCALVGVFLWCLFLRPRILVEDDVLRLRNAFSDVQVPLARVDHVAVTMFTNVVTDQGSFRSTALTRSRKENIARGGAEAAPDPMNNLSDLAESTINQLVDDAKAQNLPAGQVTSAPALVELGVLAALFVLSVVLVFVV